MPREVPMTRSHTLARGPRVRLRLARPGDRGAVCALLVRIALSAPELEAARLVRADPRDRLVIVATGLIGSTETLLGIGEIALDRDRAGAPARVYVDDAITEGLDVLLTDALIGRAQARAA